MQNRRTFLKMGVAGSAFLPVFADLSAKAEQKDATVKRKKEINIGIVGFGSMGYILSGSLVRCEGVRVICVCDIWKFRLFQAKHFFKAYKQEIKQYFDFKEMLDAEAKNLNAVIVASPDWMHYDQVCECLRRGLHVHCASPMADTLEKAAAMCRVAKASGRLLQIGDQRRILPVYRLAFEHVVPEMLGRLVFAHAENRMSMHPMNMFKRPPKDDVLAKYGYGNAEQYINWKWFRKYGPGSALETLASQTDLFCRAWHPAMFGDGCRRVRHIPSTARESRQSVQRVRVQAAGWLPCPCDASFRDRPQVYQSHIRGVQRPSGGSSPLHLLVLAKVRRPGQLRTAYMESVARRVCERVAHVRG